MAGDDKSLNAFGTASCPHLRRFRLFCSVLTRLYGVELRAPDLTSDEDRLSSFKRFLSGLLERRTHPWRVALRRLGTRQRMSIAHSLFLFRKTLPSREPDLSEFLDKISAPSPEPSADFLDFCTKEISKIFAVGWDRSLYPNACLRATVSVKSCLENGRTSGGCRSWVLDSRMPDITDREAFVISCLTKEKYSRPKPSRLVAVDTGGKWRKITVPSGELSLLRPLHCAIYDRLSTQDWLLRGKETTRVFSDFVTVAGEKFYSGDYESATDNLNNQVSKHCLSTILMRCRSVPRGIGQMAMDSLSLPVHDRVSGRVVDQTSGQMMGYLLSFPLLCLINYLTFRYAIRREVPLKINGDDIVFRSTPEEYEEWKRTVGESGLVLSEGKTMVSGRFFTLNSCMFEGGKNRVRAVPFIRSTAMFPKLSDPEHVMSIKGRYNSFCPGFSGVRRSMLRVEYLRLNRAIIDVSRRSLTRGLGLCVTFPELVKSGHWAREAWHLALEKEVPVPAPYSEWSCRPSGFKYIRVEHISKSLRDAQKGLQAAWLESAWSRPKGDVNDWFAAMREGTFNWISFDESRSTGALRRSKLLGLSVRNCTRYLRPRRSLFRESFKSIKHALWVDENYIGELGFRSSESEFVVPGRRLQDRKQSVDPKSNSDEGVMWKLDCASLVFGQKKVIRRSDLEFDFAFGDDQNRSLNVCWDAKLSARVYDRGIGISPPTCLT